MDIDMHHRAQAGFPVDQPMEALKQDHRFVDQLLDRYLNTQDLNVKKQACTQVLHLLELHTALEETVFYPRVHSIDASLVDHSEQEHQEVKQMMEQIRSMDVSDPRCDQLFQQMADAVRHHVQSEEQQLFPKVQQSNIDLTALGLEMQACESNMVSQQAWASTRQGSQRPQA